MRVRVLACSCLFACCCLVIAAAWIPYKPDKISNLIYLVRIYLYYRYIISKDIRLVRISGRYGIVADVAAW